MPRELVRVLGLIHGAHQGHRKAIDQLITIFDVGHRTTTEESRALAAWLRELTRKHTKKDDSGREPMRALDGSEPDYYARAKQEVRDYARRHKITQRQALEDLAGPRREDHPMLDEKTWAKVLAEKSGVWRARAKALDNAGYDWSRFADRIAKELHLY
jgi:hypothetical protein